MYADTNEAPTRSIVPNRPLRFAGLGERTIHGFTAIVAHHGPGRILGLRGISRERCPDGLLLPNAKRTHTYGMRCSVDLLFLDEDWTPLVAVREVAPGHRVKVPNATHMLILPSDWDIDKWDEEAAMEGAGQ